MKTQYVRFQTLEEIGVLIRPEKIVVGYRLDDKLVNSRVDFESKVVKIFLVPLCKVF